MRAVPRLIALALLLVVSIGMPLAPVHAQTAVSPASLADELDSAVFEVQSALMTGEGEDAASAFSRALSAAAALTAQPYVDPALAADLTAHTDALGSAVTAGNQPEVAHLRGAIRGTVLAIGFAASLDAIEAGDAEGAAAWLLVRSFSPATRLARPSADSSLAIASLRAGTLTAAAAAAIVRADLLDTYQGEVRRRLLETVDDATSGRALAMAEPIGLAQALWPLLAPAYAEQAGSDALATFTRAMDGLTQVIATGDVSGISALVSELESFRAAPLTADEQSGRARQIMLYLRLVPVEFKRGVRGGEVVSDVEIQEAITFLEGARSAFSDLRPTLNQIDPVAAATISDQLGQLSVLLAATASRAAVADPAEVERITGDIEDATRALLPGDWLKAGGNADFDVVISLLEQMEAAAAAGQYAPAESARLEAYAIYDMGAEKRLLAFAPGLAQDIEVAFWQGTSGQPGLATLLANNAPISQITRARTMLVRDLSEARQRLGAGSTARGAIIFNAGSIVFREGLEAVLILASLLASMTGENRRLKRPLAIGSALALAATAVLFVLARTVLLSLSQYSERVEAIVSLIAIAVLLLVMNWFFHKVYWTKWIAKHHQRRRVIIGGMAGQALGLVALGFTSVFREGAETVLFLQSLVLDAGTTVVIQGTALGLLGVLVVGVLMFALQAKLPHKKMLIVTGLMISLVLVTMVGKTVHVLQAVGWAPIHPIGDWAPPYWMSVWLGIFPTWESALMQGLAILFVFGSYFLAERSHEKALQRRIVKSTFSTAD